MQLSLNIRVVLRQIPETTQRGYCLRLLALSEEKARRLWREEGRDAPYERGDELKGKREPPLQVCVRVVLRYDVGEDKAKDNT